MPTVNVVVNGIVTESITVDRFKRMLKEKPSDTDLTTYIAYPSGETKTIAAWRKSFEDRINYIEGDLFGDAQKTSQDTKIIIPHVCNDKACWGSGFVVPLGKHFPEARESYLDSEMTLGTVDFVQTKNPNIVVANMIAQTLGGYRPLYYNALAKCMDAVKAYMDAQKIETIIAPAFGSGLAGGDWNVIKELINDCWGEYDLGISIYYLKGTFPYLEK